MFRILNYQIVNPKKTSVLIAAVLLVAAAIIGAAIYLNAQVPDFSEKARAGEPEEQFIIPPDRSADYLSAAYSSVLPEEAQKMLAPADGAKQEKISVQTSTDSFLSKVELPKEENPEDQNIPDIPKAKPSESQELAVQTVFDSLDDQVRQTISFKNGNHTALHSTHKCNIGMKKKLQSV